MVDLKGFEPTTLRMRTVRSPARYNDMRHKKGAIIHETRCFFKEKIEKTRYVLNLKEVFDSFCEVGRLFFHPQPLLCGL